MLGRERIVAAGAKSQARPWLSVLTPFHKHDPSPLLERLSTMVGDEAEIILLDDGSGSADLLNHAIAAADRLPFPARIIVWENNRGRSAARNRLIEEARGVYMLFLDADMIPDAPDFLARWLDLIDREAPAVAFGGLSLKQAPREPETALHHFLFGRSDCRDADARARDAAQFTAASNLLVRRDVLTQVPFDNSFSGWGWEDVDWALRAATFGPIRHIDNPATHAGLDSVETLLRKCREAGPNYARMLRKHPSARRFASHRVARALRAVPGQHLARTALAALAKSDAPLPLRHAALKLYRTSIYAEHLP
ncbi:MAG TPA: glycosyltransferase family A protein [Caulobacterales bacterium]|nr:glycosyltransferase family A protein [Caulobacterales bacterium]